ncbi:ABC transporter ATP-binding protein [Salinispirillum sp. LH 10-3-1]|uniref:ABC transporter ATP-binding protein n=1 Tax=Salinispirillum sp. LH 10-3-1 TaxID=2952525 RepID=A0AB38YCY4_9GAMM
MLALTHITKSYAVGIEQQQVLNDVSLTLNPGDFTALIGPSGSGKSTLLNICGLINQPNSGRVIWQDRDISKASLSQLTQIRRDAIGFIFQTFNLIPVMSAWDNVAYPLLLTNTSAQDIQHRVDAILDAVGLRELAHKRPDKLSGGQRQRIAIARALVKQPQLIVADEPTASLDQDTALTVTRLLKDLAQAYGSAVVVATHDDRLTPWCDRICRIEHGQLVEATSHSGTTPQNNARGKNTTEEAKPCHAE